MHTLSSTRLVVFSHKRFYRTRQGYQTRGGLTVQIDALAPYFDRITLCVPVVSDPDFQGVRAAAPNITFHPLPDFQGRVGFLLSALQIRRVIRQALQGADLALAIYPGYAGALASWICQQENRPLFQWVVGNWSAQVVAVRQGRPLSSLAAHLLLKPLLDTTIRRLTRDTLTFYNGQILYDQGRPYHHTRTSSSIREQDISTLPQIRPLHDPLRLLFAGRLSPEKGIPTLLQAVPLLNAAGLPVQVTLVGAGEMEAGLKALVQRMGIAGQVTFSGYVPLGEGLFACYRASDLLVLPSTMDQQPKVLLEAMAQGLPLVASRVGGIPSLVTDGQNGLLAPPKDPAALAQAVQRLAGDPGLRARLVQSGLETARQHTVEAETRRMLRLVQDHFHLEGAPE